MWSAISRAKKNIVLEHITILEDSIITITKGVKEKYALWYKEGTFDISPECVDEEYLKIISKE
jgi:hypothetical protein